MNLLLVLLTLLPRYETIVYETIDKGKRGTMNIAAEKDSMGYHAVYTWEDRMIDIVFDSLTMATRYVSKTIGGKQVLEARQNEKFDVKFKGGRYSYRESKPVYDRHAVEFALRGFDYSPDFSTTIRFHVPELMVISADINVVGEETITSPAGTFICWKVQMEPRVLFIKIKLYFWIEKEYPYRFVKYSDTKGDHSILLIEYSKTD